MSRDFRPMDFKFYHDTYNIPSMYEGLIDVNTGKHVYSQETIYYSHKFPNLSVCGIDVFCKLIDAHLITHDIVQQIEHILGNEPCDDKELVDMTMQWFKGELVPGYYMDGNNEAFLAYIIKRIKAENN